MSVFCNFVRFSDVFVSLLYIYAILSPTTNRHADIDTFVLVFQKVTVWTRFLDTLFGTIVKKPLFFQNHITRLFELYHNFQMQQIRGYLHTLVETGMCLSYQTDISCLHDTLQKPVSLFVNLIAVKQTLHVFQQREEVFGRRIIVTTSTRIDTCVYILLVITKCDT